MATPEELRRSITQRVELGRLAGLRMVPAGVLLLVFGFGELGWHLGPWFLPTLAVTLVAAVAATAGVTSWYRQRVGRVAAAVDLRVVAAVVAVFAAWMLAQTLEGRGVWLLHAPIALQGAVLGLIVVVLSLSSRRVLSHHMVFGAVLALASVVPLGALVDVPLPPGAADAHSAPVHPLAAYAPLLAPVWLIVTGVIEHVRMVRGLARPVLALGSDADAGR